MHHPTDRIIHTTAFVTPSRGALAGTRNIQVSVTLARGHSLCHGQLLGPRQEERFMEEFGNLFQKGVGGGWGFNDIFEVSAKTNKCYCYLYLFIMTHHFDLVGLKCYIFN